MARSKRRGKRRPDAAAAERAADVAASPEQPKAASPGQRTNGRRGASSEEESRPLSALQHVTPWLPMLLVVLTVLVFARTWQYDFLEWDDVSLIVDNPRFDPPTAAGLLAFWTDDFQGFYSPLTYTAFWLQAAAFGMNGGRFHIVNLVLHAANVVLVFLLVKTLVTAYSARRARESEGRSRRAQTAALSCPAAPWLAAAAALLFAVHPLQVEAVAWVTAIKDLLSTFFALLAMLFYFGRPRAGSGPLRYWPPGTVWYVLALLAKPTVVVLGPIAVALDIGVYGKDWRSAVRDVALWLVLAVPMAVVTKLVQPSEMLEQVAPMWLRPFVAADAVQFYLAKLLAPMHLAPDYGRTPEWLLYSETWRWAWIVPFALLLLAIYAARRGARLPLFLYATFVLALAPVLGIVPFLYQRQSTVADHYMYLPFVVVAIGAGLVLAQLSGRRQAGAVAAVTAVAAVLAVLSLAQLPHWRDDAAFFTYALERHQDGTLLHMTYGQSLFKDKRYGESLIQFRWAADLRPHPDIYNNIGITLVNLKKYDEARASFERALELDPTDQSAVGNLARLDKMLGNQE
ncbi:MAG: tetratricopeptide repeat protein [Anaerolineae bacterium]